MGNQNTTALHEEEKRSVNEPPEESSTKTIELEREGGDHSQPTPWVEETDYHIASGDEEGDQVNGNQMHDTFADGENRFEPKESIGANKKDTQIHEYPPTAIEEKVHSRSSDTGEELNGSATSDDNGARASKKRNSDETDAAPWLHGSDGKETGSIITSEPSQSAREETEDKMAENSHELAPVSTINSKEGDVNHSQIPCVKDLGIEEDDHMQKPTPTEKPSADFAIEEERKDTNNSVHEENWVKVEASTQAVKADTVTDNSHADSGSDEGQDSVSVQKPNGHHAVDDTQLEGQKTDETWDHHLTVPTETEVELRSDPSADEQQVNTVTAPEKKLETNIWDNGISQVIPESNKEDPNIEGTKVRENQIRDDAETEPIVTINPKAVQASRDEITLEGSPVKPEQNSKIQKAPSFNFDFLNLKALEQSDQTPLLFQQRKAPAFRSLSSPGDVRFSNPYGTTEAASGGQWLCKEKTITIVMERKELAKPDTHLLRVEQVEDEGRPLICQQEAVKSNGHTEQSYTTMHHQGRRELVVVKGRHIRDNNKSRAYIPSFLSSCICCTGIGQINAADP